MAYHLEAEISNLQAQLQSLQRRVSMERPYQGVNTYVPLQRPRHDYHDSKEERGRPRNVNRAYPNHVREKKDYREQREQKEYKVVSLKDVLTVGEEVTLKVLVRTDGVDSHTTAVSVFDGTHLSVKLCELVPELVNTVSDKPGQLLYQFIDGLLEKGHLKRRFSVAPWRLCFVTRDGVEKTLEELRN